MVDEKRNVSDPSSDVPTANAAKPSAPAVQVGGDTATRHANRPSIVVAGASEPPLRSSVTSTNTKRNRPPGEVTKLCEHCSEDYLTKRPNQSKFCSAGCRRAAWMEANPKRAAEIQAADRQRLKNHFLAQGREWVEKEHEHEE